MKTTAYIFLTTIVMTSCHNDRRTDINHNITAKEIMQKAHAKAGGDFWKNPKSLTLKGHANFYQGKDTLHNEIHNMWRVYASKKEDAHIATGKVKIESIREGIPKILLSFDGNNTYDLNGKQEKSEADNMWSSAFGYGAIRHTLEEGYEISIVGEDMIKNQNTATVKVIDPNKGETFFDITLGDFKIVKVAFDTPRGWHHRLYSNFFEKEKYTWLQSGLVELFYNDIKTNEVIWTDFEVNEELPDSLFVLTYNQ